MLIFRGKGLKARLVRGALGVGGLKLLHVPLTLITSILLARGLGPEGYGNYSFVMAVITLMVLPIGPGPGQLITREVSRYHHGEEWGYFRGLLTRAHQWVLLGAVLLLSAISLFSVDHATWAADDRWTLFFVASFMLPLLGFMYLSSATLRGLKNVFYAQLPIMLAKPGLHMVIVSCLLALGMLNPASAIFSQILAAGFASGLGAWFLWRRKPLQLSRAQPEYQHGLWARALVPFTLLAVVSNFNGQIGILALGWLGADEDIAALRVAISGSMLVVLSISIINLVIGTHVTRAHRDNDKPRLQRLSKMSARAALAISLPIALLLIFFGGPIVEVLYGVNYRNVATQPLAILAIGQLVNVAFGSVGLFLSMCGHERDTLTGQIIALSVNALSALILIPSLGAVGAALSVSISVVVWNIVLSIRFYQRLGFRPSAF